MVCLIWRSAAEAPLVQIIRDLPFYYISSLYLFRLLLRHWPPAWACSSQEAIVKQHCIMTCSGPCGLELPSLHLRSQKIIIHGQDLPALCNDSIPQQAQPWHVSGCLLGQRPCLSTASRRDGRNSTRISHGHNNNNEHFVCMYWNVYHHKDKQASGCA